MKTVNCLPNPTKFPVLPLATKSWRRMQPLLVAVLSFLPLCIAFFTTNSALAQRVALIGLTNTVWHYRPNTNNPGYTPADAWTGVAFDDSTWPTGRGVFGYESSIGIYPPQFNTYIVPPNGVAAGNPIFPGQPGSPLSPGPNVAGTGGPSAYFRTHFNWTNPITAGVTFSFTNYVDDGIIVYLNGVELLAWNIPATRPMTWDVNAMPGGANPAPFPEPTIVPTNVIPVTLITGDNVLAVELHQQGTGSSDDIFDMNLIATVPFRPIITDTTQPSNRIVLQHRVSALFVRADASDPVSYQWFKDNVPLLNATNASFTIPDMSAADAGNYYVSVSNPVGTTNSRTAVVGYTTDTNPPVLVRASGNATFDKIIVEFNELMDAGTISDNFNYSFDPVLQPSSATPNPDGRSVTLTLDPAFPESEDTLYTLTVNNVADAAGNAITTNNTVKFRSWTTRGTNGMVFEAYRPLSTTDNSILIVRTNANFPNHPDETLHLTRLDSREVYPDDSHEGYGGRIRGVFVPPVSGNWIFYLRSDDSSELYFNANGPDAAGKALIANETGCCNPYLAQGRQTSLPQTLVLGQPYYIEAIYKEGTGGDYVQVAAALEGDPLPVAPTTIPSASIGFPALPTEASDPVTISQQPADTGAIEGSTATFTVGITSVHGLPVWYQWRRNGVDISGANKPYYSLVATPADDGALFSVNITPMAADAVLSRGAKLIISHDTNGPIALSASADSSGTNVLVTFNEPVGAATAQNTANWAIDGVAPATATVTNSTNVLLTTASPLAICVQHSVRVSNVEDLFSNKVVPNPTTLPFVTEILLIGFDANNVWKYEDTGARLDGTGWQNRAYDDSGWSNGPALLAHEPDNNTPIPIRTQLDNFTSSRITYYFRKHFNLPDASGVTRLQIREVLDDGATYYLNGTEIYSNRMPAGVITYDTLTSAGSTEPHPLEGPSLLPLTALISGDNVLAVEVHQSSTTSSDIVFGAELIATVSSCRPRLTISRSGADIIISWDAAGAVLEHGSVLGSWSIVNGASSPYHATASGYYRLRQP